MNRKTLFQIPIVLALILINPLAIASIQTYTQIKGENGFISIKQRVNNNTLNISVNSSGKTFIQTNVTEENISYSINSTGKGEVKVESNSKNYEVNLSSDSKDESYSGTGSFNKIISFVNNLFISGWMRILSI